MGKRVLERWWLLWGSGEMVMEWRMGKKDECPSDEWMDECRNN